jgi:hypothetical protein
MTQEEKARAYDEVREKIALRFGSNVAEEIFSEFEMSEDERIRKEIIAILQYKYEKFPNDPKYCNAPQWIAWLEKQGQKSAEWHREDEQNLNACLGYIPDEFLRRWLTDIIHIKYDKSTWSKEDDVMVHDILGWIPAKSRPEYNQRRADWLKSLKDRVQPEQEWSEEDEEMIGGLNNCLDELEKENGWRYIYVNSKNVELNKVRNWVKSLKQRIGG